MEKISLADKLAQIREHWRPKLIGELNGQEVKLVKFRGEFVWHRHEGEDELFLALRGRFRIEFRDRTVELGRSPRRKWKCCCSSRRVCAIPATWSMRH